MSAYVGVMVWELVNLAVGMFLAGVVVAYLVASRITSRRYSRQMDQAVALVSRDLGGRHVRI